MASSIEINGNRLDLFEENQLALNFQANDIGQLDDRQVEYSNQISIPKTSNNLKILANINVPNTSIVNGAYTPEYLINTANVTVDGYLSLPSAALKIDSTGSVIDISIQSGGATFYRLASNILLNDPNSFYVGDLNFDYSEIGNILPSSISDDLMFPMIGNEDVFYKIDEDVQYNQLLVANMYPALRVDYILKKIETLTGYTLPGLELLPNTVFTLPSVEERTSELILAVSALNFQEFQYSTPPAPFEMTNPVIEDPFGNWTGTEYTIPEDGFYQFNFTVEQVSPNTGQLKVVLPGGTEWNNGPPSFENPPYTETGIFFPAGSVVSVTGQAFAANANPYINTTNFNFQIYRLRGNFYDVSANMPEWTALDFIKEMATMYGFLIVVDEITREVNFKTLGDVNANRANALDLTKRAFITEPKFTYDAAAFSRISKFSFAGNYPMESNLYFANEWAQDIGDVWAARSSGAKNVQNNVWYSDQAYCFGTVSDERAGNYTYRLGETDGVLQTWTSSTPDQNIKFHKYGWEYWLYERYPEMKQMLLNWLQVEVNLFLSSKEIQDLSYLTPVFWDSQYWYVNKISNYILGLPCTMNLIRLQESTNQLEKSGISSYRFNFAPGMGFSGKIVMQQNITLTTETANTGETYTIIVNEVAQVLPISLFVSDVVYLDRTSNPALIGYVELSE